MQHIIGIIGFKGSGKDTVGDYLVREHGYERDSFAGSLKDAISAIFGWERQLLEGSTSESREWRETPDTWWEDKLDWKNHEGSYLSDRFTPRIAMQFWGTDILRKNFHNDLWILSLQSRLRNKNKVVITDCRFPNEFKTIKDSGGLALRIKRGPEPEWYDSGYLAGRGLVCHKDKMKRLGIHESEWAWLSLDFDHVLENDGVIVDLERKVECLIPKKF
jgi:hypothetical protein